MAKTRVLYVLHNHPTLFPGGAEQYALELFEALRGSDEIEPLLLARIGRTSMPQGKSPRHSVQHASTASPISTSCSRRASPPTTTSSERRGTSRSTRPTSPTSCDAYKPDVVHFQHTLHMGYDLVSTARRVLPHAPILYTLHEYLPICHRQGQMLRTEHKNEELCLKASPRRCSECFPDIPSSEFFLRERSHQGAPRRTSTSSSRRASSCSSATWIGAFRPTASSARTTVAGRRSGWPRPRGTGRATGSATSASSTPTRGSRRCSRRWRRFEDRPDIQLRLHGANLDQQTTSSRRASPTLLEARRGERHDGRFVSAVGPAAADARHRLGRRVRRAGGRTLRW